MSGYSFTDIESKLLEVTKTIQGTDTDEKEYDSILDLWNSRRALAKAKDGEKKEKWYQDAFNYWEKVENCPLSDDGVLGGYGKLTPMDTRDSNLFLDELSTLRPELQFERAADCGAGIGRVSKHFLLHRFAHVDLIEQSPRLLRGAPEYLGSVADRASYIVIGLQDFEPAPNSYDVIWIQWVIGHLHDLDFIRFFQRCARGLRSGGVIILKDNCAENWTFVVDKTDSSVARCPEYIRLLLELSGLQILLEKPQTDFPEDLYPVRMFALASQSQLP